MFVVEIILKAHCHFCSRDQLSKDLSLVFQPCRAKFRILKHIYGDSQVWPDFNYMECWFELPKVVLYVLHP